MNTIDAFAIAAAQVRLYAEQVKALEAPYRSRSGRVIAHTFCLEGDSPRCEACRIETEEETR